VRTVFFDVDTQIDFLYPAGALYAPGAEGILPAIERLNGYAATHGIPVVSTTDAHAENDAEFAQWPPHCVVHTAGQQKPRSTLLEKRVAIPSTAGEYPVNEAQQFLIEKQALDCFTNPNLSGLLARLDAERYVVYGVVTEYCVRCAAVGLLKTGERVELVTDAIQSLSEEGGRRTIDEFVAGGGHLTTTAAILDAG